MSRRTLLKGTAAAITSWTLGQSRDAFCLGFDPSVSALPHARPKPADRHFISPAVEETILTIQKKIADPALAILFENCLPNTLDTTVSPRVLDGKPDTFVVTGDIDAMWLRDSSAQMWPYLPLLKRDDKLRELLEGVIRRQGRSIRLDPYANAFTRNSSDPALSWAVADLTKHIPGVGERKWEIDSLCYPIRLAHGFWKAGGGVGPFDAEWRQTAWTILKTFREQQRKVGRGPYSFQRSSPIPSDTVPLGGFGNPVRPNGMIFSMFRPSDDACIYPLFVPANLFAVVSLRQLAEMAQEMYQDSELRSGCLELAAEVDAAIRKHGVIDDPQFGRMWAYEVDGYGNVLKMDDANAPGLLSLPYLGCCGIGDPLYRSSRAFALSPANPYFFHGKAAEGIGGPHIGLNYVWPMSIMQRALSSTSDVEIRQCLRWLRDTTAGTGFMHESFHCDNPKDFTRPWFAWANTLFGELILKLAAERPALLAAPLD